MPPSDGPGFMRFGELRSCPLKEWETYLKQNTTPGEMTTEVRVEACRLTRAMLIQAALGNPPPTRDGMLLTGAHRQQSQPERKEEKKKYAASHDRRKRPVVVAGTGASTHGTRAMREKWPSLARILQHMGVLRRR